MRNVQVSSHFDLMLLDYQWTLILIFCVDVHMGLDPLPPVHMRPPEPDTLPLRVDVINGWPLRAGAAPDIRLGGTSVAYPGWGNLMCVPVSHVYFFVGGGQSLWQNWM